MTDYCKAVEETGFARLVIENEALRAENAKLREALKPFSRHRLSSETHTTTLEYLSPLGELQRQIAQIEKHDAEIRKARAALISDKLETVNALHGETLEKLDDNT